MSTPFQSLAATFGKLVEQINPVAGVPAPAPVSVEGVLPTAAGEKTVVVVVSKSTDVEDKTVGLVEKAASNIAKEADEVKNTSPAIAAADGVIVIPEVEEKKVQVVVDQPKVESKVAKESAAIDNEEEDLQKAIALSNTLHAKAPVVEVKVDVKELPIPEAKAPVVEVKVDVKELPVPVVADTVIEEGLPPAPRVLDGFVLPAEGDPFWLPVEVKLAAVVKPVHAAAPAPQLTQKALDDVALLTKFCNKKERKDLGSKEKKQARKVVKEQKRIIDKFEKMNRMEQEDKKIALKLQEKFDKQRK